MATRGQLDQTESMEIPGHPPVVGRTVGQLTGFERAPLRGTGEVRRTL